MTNAQAALMAAATVAAEGVWEAGRAGKALQLAADFKTWLDAEDAKCVTCGGSKQVMVEDPQYGTVPAPCPTCQ